MSIFIELTPAVAEDEREIQKRMYRLENMDSFEDADVNGKEYTFIQFNESSNLVNLVVKESYMDIWTSLNDLNLIEEVTKD
jgi:hypothetical protein